MKQTKEFLKERVLSSELYEHVGKKVTVYGWLHKKREMGGMTFLLLRDRGGLMQVVDEKSIESKKLEGLYAGTVLLVTGKVIEDKRASIGAELHEPEITVISPVAYVSSVEIDKPIDHKPENLDGLFENKVVNIRNLTEQNIWKIQAGVGKAIREYLEQNEFTEFHSPKLLAGATEGGAEVFKTDYFGKEATLAQSPQFYKQIMVGSLERVYEIGAVYRAEPSATTRHMTEYMSVDLEFGFINSFQDVLDTVGGLLIYVTKRIWETHEKELLSLGAKKVSLKNPIPSIPLSEVHELFLKETGEDMRKELDPTPAEERFITEYSAKHLGTEAVHITEFPAVFPAMKFYHHKNEENPKVTDRADLIFRGVEIATVPMREHRYEKLIEQLKDFGGDPEHPGFKYYLQAFKYGMPPHGGCGLGLERLTQKIIGLNNVKEATLFPRDINRLTP